MLLTIIVIILAILSLAIYFINKRLHLFGSFGRFMLGLGFAIVLAIVFFVLMLMLSGANIPNGDDIFIFSLMFIGLSQLIYIVPVVLILIRNKQYDMMKGVITGAVLMVLLNGGCFAFLLPNMRIGG